MKKKKNLHRAVFAMICASVVAFFWLSSGAEAAVNLQTLRASSNNLGLVGLWSLDGADVTDKVYDRSGQGVNGTFIGGATSTAKVAGKIGQAMRFDGVGNYVSIPDPNIAEGLDSVTVSAWVKSNVPNHAASTNIVSQIGAGPDAFGVAWNSSENIVCSFYDTAHNVQSGTFLNGITDTNWHLVTCVLNGANDTITAYVDGVAGSSVGTITTVTDATSNAVQIGASGGVGFWDGVIDDVRIYNRAFSSNDVKRHYASGKAAMNASMNDSLTNGLIGEWSFDGADITDKIYDRSGSNNHAWFTSIATSTAKAPGRIGQGVKFASSGYVSFPDMIEGLNAVTASVWAKPDLNNNSTKNLFSQGGAGRDPIVMTHAAGTGSNDYKFACAFDNGAMIASTPLTAVGYNDGAWHHVVCLYDGSAVYLYVDGVSTGVGESMTGPLASTANAFTLGSASSPWDGSLDEARVYNRALSVAEIRQLYAMGNSKANASQNSQLTSGLVGLWSFDGADITTSILDRSGTGNNATFVGGATSSAKVMGKIGQALNFDGVDDAVVIGDIAVAENTSAFSVSAWVQFAVADTPSTDYVVAKDRSGLTSWALSRSSTEQLTFEVTNSVPTTVSASFPAASVRDTNWHHVVGTYDGANVTVYLDGVASTPAAQTGTIRNRSEPVCVAARSTGAGCTSNVRPMKVDDVRMYNRGLTAADVMRLYNLGR